jgi:hypothetical protein
MTTANGPWSGGCQCGAVRFRAASLGLVSFCHCRMCQKAFGSIGGAFVIVLGLVWTRGALKHFQSSNQVRRGFCADCGTPLTYEHATGLDVAISAFDRAGEIVPTVQLARAARLPWSDGLPSLPVRSVAEQAAAAATRTDLISYQHPDHDTADWPMKTLHP